MTLLPSTLPPKSASTSRRGSFVARVTLAAVTLGISLGWLPLPGWPDHQSGRASGHGALETAREHVPPAPPTAEVIVGIDAPFTPEGHLEGPTEVDAQRRRLAAARDAVMARARNAGVVVTREFDHIPFFEATVTAATFDTLATLPGVRSIERVRTLRPALAVTVPLVNAPAAWSAGATGAGWTVAVLDTGIEGTHEFLTGKVTSEACYSTPGGGYTSYCPGGAASSTAPGSGAPCVRGVVTSIGPSCGHGTQVAGVVAGKNGQGGINGVAPDARLISIQVYRNQLNCLPSPLNFDCTVASSGDVVAGLNRVLTLAGASNVNKIASVLVALADEPASSTCDSAYPSMKAAIDNLRSIGIPTVAAAGNNGSTTQLALPACISSAISVGATRPTGQMFTNSQRTNALHLVAPGAGFNTPTETGNNIRTSNIGNTYINEANFGTSFAAAHVAGAWAVIRQSVPTATVDDVLTALRSTGTQVADPTVAGRTFPRINIDAARIALGGTPGSTAPGAPVGLSATVTGSTIGLTWQSGAGGTPTNYTLIGRLSPGGPVLASLPLGNVTSFSIAAPNGTFVLTIRADNAQGASAESTPVTVTVPQAPQAPGAPSGLTVTVSGATASFGWSAPGSGGAPTGYTLLAGVSPGFAAPIASLPLPANPRAVSIGGIPAGTYFVRLLATNSGGASGPSNEVTLTVAGPAPPAAPVLNTPVVSGGTVSLSWIPASGPAATGFTLVATATPSGAPIVTVPLSGTSVAFPGVPSGTYYLRLVAVNSAGNSAPSNQVTLVVP